ncbi:hypothetical protein [Planktothrix serta]|uniref:hypothetical protein n=1 Tax=Planktothrix serta TaxID=1678310 RepID=UPI0012DD4DCC|nr:hypothetical protein [Planktothrix serta]
MNRGLSLRAFNGFFHILTPGERVAYTPTSRNFRTSGQSWGQQPRLGDRILV